MTFSVVNRIMGWVNGLARGTAVGRLGAEESRMEQHLESARGWSRSWLLGAIAVPLLLLSIALPALFRPCPVTRAALERVKEGMSRPEVEAILGGPPSDYRTRPVELYVGTFGDRPWEFWRGDEGDAWVYYEGGVVGGANFVELAPIPISTFELLQWRLGRWTRRWLP
jgi:hypothetical protein